MSWRLSLPSGRPSVAASPRRVHARGWTAALLLCGMAWTAPSARSEESAAIQAFADLETRFEEAFAKIDEPVAKLNTAYVDALHRLLSSETAAGKLDAALQVKTE